MKLDHNYCKTTGGILKIISLLFNILAIIFVQSSEYPYYAVKGIIVYDALPVAGIVFSLISLLLLIFNQRLQTSTIWQRNEWFILCCLIIIYIYTLVHMIGATVQCYDEAHRCPWQLYATISGICATIIYCIDIVYRTIQCRQKKPQQVDGFCEAVTTDDDDDDDEVDVGVGDDKRNINAA